MGTANHWEFDANGLRAFIVVNRWSRDLAAGGLRFTPGVTLRELERLARTMTHKWAILGLPFGGAKLGIRDSGVLDKKVALQEFGKAAGDVMRDRIITGPDLGTDGHDISVFYRAMGEDPYENAAIPLSRQGYHPTPRPIYARFIKEMSEEITGLAVTRAALASWEIVGGSEDPPTVAIQGFGSVGRVVAEEMTRRGARVLCIADAEGCLRHPEGLALEALSGGQPGLMNRSGLPEGTEEASRDAWLDGDADLLVPASIPDAINEGNLNRVRAKMVVEAANIPVPEEIEGRLHRHGVFVLPDFLVNGGAAATYGLLLIKEWSRKKDLREEVFRRIVGGTTEVVERSLEEGTTPRRVAVETAEARLKAPESLP